MTDGLLSPSGSPRGGMDWQLGNSAIGSLSNEALHELALRNAPPIPCCEGGMLKDSAMHTLMKN